ncbi:hypothetical protein R4I97_04135 [Brachyspira pilosicoli]|uniref:hypothetical protein n=1 Tax=Brachyspira pilosicoli TaxID=52584 RepID=UPI003004AF6E
MLSLRKALEKKDFELVDLFTLSFSLFRHNFVNFLLVGFLCAMPTIITTIYFPPAMFDPAKMQTPKDIIDWFQNEVNEGFYINLFLSWFLDIISTAAIALLVEGLVYDKIRTASYAIVKTFQMIIPILITSIITIIIYFFGLSFFIFPGIVLMILFMFTTNICALRHTWGIDAIKYSFSLVKPKFFKSLSILAFIVLFQNAFIITFPSAPIDTREGVLYYFLSMIILYFFDTYFKILISLYFLNRDFVTNATLDDDI